MPKKEEEKASASSKKIAKKTTSKTKETKAKASKAKETKAKTSKVKEIDTTEKLVKKTSKTDDKNSLDVKFADLTTTSDQAPDKIKIEDFGRRAVILAKQTLIQRVKDLEKEVIINKYEDLVGLCKLIIYEYSKTASS